MKPLMNVLPGREAFAEGLVPDIEATMSALLVLALACAVAIAIAAAGASAAHIEIDRRHRLWLRVGWTASVVTVTLTAAQLGDWWILVVAAVSLPVLLVVARLIRRLDGLGLGLGVGAGRVPAMPQRGSEETAAHGQLA